MQHKASKELWQVSDEWDYDTKTCLCKAYTIRLHRLKNRYIFRHNASKRRDLGSGPPWPHLLYFCMKTWWNLISFSVCEWVEMLVIWRSVVVVPPVIWSHYKEPQPINWTIMVEGWGLFEVIRVMKAFHHTATGWRHLRARFGGWRDVPK